MNSIISLIVFPPLGFILILNKGSKIFSRCILGIMGLISFFLPLFIENIDIYFFAANYFLLQIIFFLFSAGLANVPIDFNNVRLNLDVGTVLLAIVCCMIGFELILSLSYTIPTRVSICSRIRYFGLVSLIIFIGLSLCSYDFRRFGSFLSLELSKVGHTSSWELEPMMAAMLFGIVAFLLIIDIPFFDISKCIFL